MIGEAYRSIAAQAVLGPSRSQLVPAVLHIGWLDPDGLLIEMAGVSVTHDVFGPAPAGVTNTSAIDAGIAGVGWTIGAIGFYDAPVGGALVVSAAAPAVLTPAEDEPLSFEPGTLVFTVS